MNDSVIGDQPIQKGNIDSRMIWMNWSVQYTISPASKPWIVEDKADRHIRSIINAWWVSLEWKIKEFLCNAKQMNPEY